MRQVAKPNPKRRNVIIAAQNQPQALLDEKRNRLVTLSYNELIQVNIAFLEYVDPAGNRSRSRGGLIIELNKLLKRRYNIDINDLGDEQQFGLAMLRRRVVGIIRAGMKELKLRREIKNKIWAAVDRYAPLIQEMV
jgi:hypothetical protein